MRDLNDLMYFAAVVDNDGFTAASRDLNIPKSTLSRRITALEERLDVCLLHRSTRKLVVTEVGRRFYVHCKSMLAEAEAAESVADATHIEPCGSLHVSCPIGLLHMQMSSLLVSFAEIYPKVSLQLSAMNRSVDVIAEGVDVALRMTQLPLPDSELTMKKLGEFEQCLVASPKLVDSLGVPETPADLQEWPTLGNGNAAMKHSWLLRSRSGEEVNVVHQPRFMTTDMQTLSIAAQRGRGVALLPTRLIQGALNDSSLITLLPEWKSPPYSVHALFASRHGLSSSVRALLDHLAGGFDG
jgi:DNA-binding transcriptional LysR family regulator